MGGVFPKRGRVRCVLWFAFVVTLAAVANAAAVTLDITAQFRIERSDLVRNPSTKTFEQTVRLTNVSTFPVVGPVKLVVGGLHKEGDVLNAEGRTPDGKPYVVPLAGGGVLPSGSSLTVLLQFPNASQFVRRSPFQLLHTVETPADAPVLFGVVATGGSNARVVGRVEGLPGMSLLVQASASSVCVAGTLVGGMNVGTPQAATTDSQGYFAFDLAGVAPGTFVAIRLAAPRVSATSLCQVSGRDNDSWPKAFTLDGLPEAQDLIDAPGKARWYRFAILPGQRIDLALTDLPADYDLVVFKDIGQAFAEQFNPATATSHDLLRLAAQTAPSVFSPSVFSPSVFSPDAYSPSVFSPSVFSPSVFSPSVFSPSVFSPSVFSPSVFSPSVFSPSVFSPSVFSPSVFSPSVFSPEEIARAFSTAQTRSVVSVAATPGTASEATVVNTWNSTGYFYARVTGRSGAFDTTRSFRLTVTKGATSCAGVNDTTVVARSQATDTGRRTVLLVDSGKLALDEPLLVSGGGTLGDRLASFAGRSEVKGVVVDVGKDARVLALKAQATAHPACPFAKNLVAEEIKRIVDSYRANPLRYVVLVGNDDSIPFFRTPDQSSLGQESSYVPPVESNSPSEASLRRDFVLSQDGYGSSSKLSLGFSDIPMPGLAVGRLVETIDEIAGVIDAYVAVNGVVVPSTSLVTGYDFLEDAANAVKSELALGTGKTPDALVTPNGVSPQDPASWSATQLGQALLGKRHDVVFLAGHFSANSALAADFATGLFTSDLAASTVDMANAVVFSAGCHSGFNLVDGDAIAGVTMPLDWAQAFARKRATLIAGTGYQYGDTDFLEYSERLYRNFARAMRAGTGPVSIGEALVNAKLDYLAATTEVRGIHEKALLQATLFGLPMLAVDMPAGRGALPGTAPVVTPTPIASGPAQLLGLRTHDISVATPFVSRSLALKDLEGGPDVVVSWLDGPEGVLSTPGEPVLPLHAVNVTPTDASIVLRGTGFRGGTYVDTAPIVPLSGAPSTEIRTPHVPFASPVFHPARMWTPNYFGALAGSGGTQLLLSPVQHKALDPATGTSTQRRFTNVNLRLYYSGNLSQAALSEAPSVIAVEGQRAGADALFSVQVIGDPAAAIHEVWVTYTSVGGSAWASLDLVQCVAPLPAECPAADSRLWKGRLANAPANLKYVVQAASGIGLVTLDDNGGAHYGVATSAPLASTLQWVSTPAGGTVGSSTSVEVGLTAGGDPLAGKTVVVSVGGVSRLATSDAQGVASFSIPVTAQPGSHMLAAFFAGDEEYAASSLTTPFVVSKAVVALSALAPAGVVLTGTLGGTTQALQGEAVAFAVSGPVGPTTIWATTDALGRALLPPPGLTAGDYVVTGASFAGNGTFATANVSFPPGVLQFTVSPIAQNIGFGTVADAPFGFPPFEVYSLASSGLPVAFAGSGSCAVAGNVVYIGGLGVCTLTATQAGNAVYGAAPPVVRTFTVSKAAQVIAFGPAPSGVSAGQPLVTVSATSTSPAGPPSAIPIAFSSLTPSVCTVGAGPNSALVAPLTAGTCSIAADQAGDTVFDPAAQAVLNFIVGPAGAAPATFTVRNLNDSGSGSLRAAIGQANDTPGPNIVDFQPGLTGTITLTSGQIPISGPTRIVGPGPASLTISGNFNSRIFGVFVTSPACPAIDGPVDYLVSISGLRLINGRRNVADSSAGAIYTEHSLALDDVEIENSAARTGGGVYFAIQYAGQSLTIANSRFLNNVATEVVPPLQPFDVQGGAVNTSQRCPNALDTPYTYPVTVTITGSEFRGNSVQPLSHRDGRGGALRSWSLADITIADTLVVDNHVDAPVPPPAGFVYHGGAFDGTARSLRIERSEFSDNSANDATGSDATRSGALHVHNTAIDRQVPGSVMALKIINSTLSGNLASATAGAMLIVGNVAAEIANSTVAHNVAAPTRTGGVALSRGGTTYPASAMVPLRPSLTLASSILANNSSTGGDVAASSSGQLPSFAIHAFNSLVRTPCPAPNCLLSFFGGGNLFGVDPLLAPLLDSGGPSRTHALLPASPAIDAGSNPLGLATDQRGAGFPRVSGAGADMGAYESP